MSNPFMLTFGKEPKNYIDRIKDASLVIDTFTDECPSSQTFMITGVRGSGKTVLLTTITKEFIKRDDWIVTDLSSDNDYIECFASELYQNSKLKTLFIKNKFNFSFKGIEFSLEGENPILTKESLVKKMLDKIIKQKKRVLITIDEVSGNDKFKEFAKFFQTLIRFEYPVFLLMTGLYENIYKIQNDESLTFLYRAPKIYLNSLNILAIMNSYKKIFNIEDDDAIKLANLTCGYAYAYQTLGYILYSKRKTKIDNDCLALYDQYLSEYVYDKIFTELTSVEKEILFSIKTDKKIKINDLKKLVNRDSSYLSLYRDRLIKKGILLSPEYGYVKFALPRMSEYFKVHQE